MITVRQDPKNRRVIATIEKMYPRFRRGIKAALHEIGSENVNFLRKIIRDKNKTGRLYFIRGKIHQASAPGEAPANLTGRLAKTADYKVRGTYQCEFGDKAFYGVFLEDGTTRMLPRPHIIRTVKKKERDNYRSLADNTHRLITRL